MRMFKNKNHSQLSLFGDSVDSANVSQSDSSDWLASFAKKQAGVSEGQVDSSSVLNKKVLGHHAKDAGGHVGSLSVKSASDSIFDQKDPPAPKAAKKKKPVDEPVEEKLPTSAERMAMHVASTSSPAGGRGLIRTDSISIFDDKPFDHIENKQKAPAKVAETKSRSPQKAMNSRSVSENLFDKLSAVNSIQTDRSSDRGAVKRMFDAMKNGGIE